MEEDNKEKMILIGKLKQGWNRPMESAPYMDTYEVSGEPYLIDNEKVVDVFLSKYKIVTVSYKNKYLEFIPVKEHEYKSSKTKPVFYNGEYTFHTSSLRELDRELWQISSRQNERPTVNVCWEEYTSIFHNESREDNN